MKEFKIPRPDNLFKVVCIFFSVNNKIILFWFHFSKKLKNFFNNENDLFKLF